MGVWGHCPQQAGGRKCECVLTLALLASCVWLSTHIACLYLKQPQRPLCRCGKLAEIQALGGNEYEKDLSCEFNLDTACVELRMDDGMLLPIDCTAVENEVANSTYQRSELD